jgi:proteic killer suppression protein
VFRLLAVYRSIRNTLTADRLHERLIAVCNCTVVRYYRAIVIESWRDAWLRSFFFQDLHSQKIPADLRDRLFRKLQLLADSETDADLRVPPSNHFQRLSGNLEGWHSIRVNDQWRLIFRWADGQAKDVYLDNHSYR